MSNNLKLDYFYGNEAEQYSFYRIPRVLFKDKKFKEMSVDAKVLYGLILDRMGVSQKNNWIDKQNRVYIYFTNEDASEYLGYSHSKISKLFYELDTERGFGLIERVKQGQGRPTLIYVKSFISLDRNYNENKENFENAKNNKKYSKPKVKTSQIKKSEKTFYTNDEENFFEEEKTFSTDITDFNENTLDLSENTYNSVDNSVDNLVDNLQSTNNSDPDFLKTEVLTSQIKKSRHSNLGSLDFSKTDANYNNSSNLEENYNNSVNIYPSKSSLNSKKAHKTKSSLDSLIDGWDNDDIDSFVFRKIVESDTLPFEFLESKTIVKVSLEHLTEFEKKRVQDDETELSILELFIKALTQMLTTTEMMSLNGSNVSYHQVYEKLCENINFSYRLHSHTIFELYANAVKSFSNSCERKEIKYPLAYMKSCIWTIMVNGTKGINSIDARQFYEMH
ncbi:MAG: replication initiator protein A [Clostridia bacterium]